MKLLVTGGAGFIGSNFVRLALRRWPQSAVVVLDKLTYAGHLANLASSLDDPRLTFVQGDVCDAETVSEALRGCTHLINFAAETHVDRSILDPGSFVRTDVEGTRVLLACSKQLGIERYLQVSTDEVYGHIPAPARADESDRLAPRSPYSASKAAGDLMVGAYHVTYGLPTLVTRGANTYGPYQYPEKLVSLFATNALEGEPLPVYGDGMQMRDWLYVDDHCTGIAMVLERGEPGQTYNLGTGDERPNLEVVQRIVDLTGCDPSLVWYVPDRPGHDRRYALETARVSALGWMPATPFETGLEHTIEWYRRNRDWWEPIKGGGFREYYARQYAERLRESRR